MTDESGPILGTSRRGMFEHTPWVRFSRHSGHSRHDARRVKPIIPQLLGIERSLAADIRRVLKVLFSLIDRELVQEIDGLRELSAFDSARKDDISDEVRRIHDKISVEFAERISDTAIEELAARRGMEVSEMNRKAMQRQWKRALGVDVIAESPTLGRVLDRSAKKTASLITRMTRQHLQDVETIVTEGLSSGLNTRAIAKRIQAKAGVTRRRANLIARDQVSKLNGIITKERQASNGITYFRWVTVGDERVRDEHADLDGDIFSWETGHPEEGFPGQPVNCRCIAEPVFSDEVLERSAAFAGR